MQVLVSAYKTEQRKGKPRQIHREECFIELRVLQLLYKEGQKCLQAYRSEKWTTKEPTEGPKKDKEKPADKLVAEAEKPF